MRRLCSLSVLAWSVALGATSCGGKSSREGGPQSGAQPSAQPDASVPLDAGNPLDIHHCTRSSECVLASASCCVCTPSALQDVLALRSDAFQAFRARVDRDCGGPLGCDCPYPVTASNLLAACRDGRCVAVDLLAAGAQTCSDSSQCFLRGGTDCCPDCAQDRTLVPLSNQSVFEGLACDPGSTLCSCPVPSPQKVWAECFEGRCIENGLLL